MNVAVIAHAGKTLGGGLPELRRTLAAENIRGAGKLKDRVGRVAYVLSGSQNLRLEPFGARIRVDGVTWFAGEATCILAGNVGELFGGVEVFADASPVDGLLDLGVVTAEGPVQWTRTLARTVVGSAARSPFVRVTKGTSIEVKLDRKVAYELDGGDRRKVRRFSIEVDPGAVSVCVPTASGLDFAIRERPAG